MKTGVISLAAAACEKYKLPDARGARTMRQKLISIERNNPARLVRDPLIEWGVSNYKADVQLR
jgi:hypothetical protein